MHPATAAEASTAARAMRHPITFLNLCLSASSDPWDIAVALKASVDGGWWDQFRPKSGSAPSATVGCQPSRPPAYPFVSPRLFRRRTRRMLDHGFGSAGEAQHH